MSNTIDLESGAVPGTALPGSVPHHLTLNQEQKNVEAQIGGRHGEVEIAAAGDMLDGEEEPTEEEYRTLPKVSAGIRWYTVVLCSIELVERASYYGCQYLFSNFVRAPLPPGGNGAGAVAKGPAGANDTSGALGMGPVKASAVGSTFTFLAYAIPIATAVWTDTKGGKWRALWVGAAIGMTGHFLLVISAIPKVIASGHAFPPFMIFVIILAFAAGFIKPALGPLLCDQSPIKKPVIKVLKSGKRVIMDPQTTISRYLLIMYFCINIGGLFGLATTYTERFVGFWAAFLIPGLLYALTPIAMLAIGKRLYHAPPQGSVVMETMRVFKVMIQRAGFFAFLTGSENAYRHAKPSYIEAVDGTVNREVITWDDVFVDEIRQSIQACAVFFLTPIFLLADNGLSGQINLQSAAMTLNNIPNDVFNNFNSLAIIVFTPILSWGVYPFFERIGYPLKPMTRLSIGFMLGCINQLAGAIIQSRIYATSPCGNQAASCMIDGHSAPSPVSISLTLIYYAVPGVGELFVMVTGYELAYTRAPARMKSLVYAVCLFSSAISAAISLACANAIQDPYVTWTFVALAVACFICAVVFPVFFRHLNDPMQNFADPARQAGQLTASTQKEIEEIQGRHVAPVEDVDDKKDLY